MPQPQRPFRFPATSNLESSVTLKYPTIPVDGTPATWLSSSQLVKMSSTHDESEDTSSSLGDSSYEFIDDRSVATTDDEDQDGMTESTTSSDGRDFDHSAALSHDHGLDSQTDQGVEAHHPAMPSRHQDSEDSQVRTYDASNQHYPLTDRRESIEFDEPSVVNLNSSRYTEVSHTLQIIPEHEVPALFSNLRNTAGGPLAVTVRQTMSSQNLTPANGSYKIMYMGDNDCKDAVVQKIGTALAAGMKDKSTEAGSPSSSKFNVVPISLFGEEESSPEVVLIDSSGLELVVEHCSHASYARKDHSRDTLRLSLSGALDVESTWDGSEFVTTRNWNLPNLAIFVTLERDRGFEKHSFQSAWSFMTRHKVPLIVISQTPRLFKQSPDYLTFDYLTPHVCLESRQSLGSQDRFILRLPIDLGSFLNIDAGQMNRNLACLDRTQRRSNPIPPLQSPCKQSEQGETEQAWPSREAFDSLLNDIRKNGLNGFNTYRQFALMLLSVLGMLLIGVGLSSFFGALRVSKSRVFPTTAVTSFVAHTSESLPASLALSVSSTSLLAATSSSFTPTYTQPVRSLSTNTDLASFLLDANSLAPNRSDQFKVHVLGDCHIVLRPPHWLIKTRKAPKLLFRVIRGNTEIGHEITTLFDGVYALQLPREEAYGMMNVLIQTEAKPKISESFDIDFGSSWLKVAGWRKATKVLTENIRNDLSTVQTSISIIYDQTKTELSTWVQQQKDRGKVQREAERVILRRHRKQVVKTSELILAQTKDVVHKVSSELKGRGSLLRRNADGWGKHARNTSATISKQARALAHAATEVDVKGLVREVGDFRRRHLRKMQKEVLKTLWKIGGAPSGKKSRVDANTQRRGRYPREVADEL
ncbi:hypothetical protein MMC21_002922 [Puttea exsequens]|nr:hypothetical protein [Puttea exsequens]